MLGDSSKIFLRVLVLALVQALALGPAFASTPPPLNLAAGLAPKQLSVDEFTAVARGYIEPSLEEVAPGKFRIGVVGNYAEPATELHLTLQTLVNDGQGNRRLVKVMDLMPITMVNPAPSPGERQRFRSSHQFNIDAADINRVLEQAFPNAPNIRALPGSQFFVHGRFSDANGSFHDWGGTDRGGGIVIPGNPPPSPATEAQRPTALDITYPQKQLASTTVGAGLDPGGHVGSRIEMEGKWAVKDETAFVEAQKRLLHLVKNQNHAVNGQRVLPPGWKITLEDRYVLKDKNAISNINPDGYVLDSRGMPVADPMVDIASDTKDFRLAKTDSVLRSRSTAQNQTSVINYKAGGAGYVVDADGIVYRPEYQLAVKGGDPATAKAFFASDHPLNFMKGALKSIGVSDPASVTEQKTVDQRANRLKFKLHGPNQLEIEVSTDRVRAQSLIDPTKAAVEYFQIEADAAHLAVRNAGNTAASTGIGGGLGAISNPIDLAKLQDPAAGPKITEQLFTAEVLDQYGNNTYDKQGKLIRLPITFGADAFTDGRPYLHTIDDLDPTSPMMTKNAADFAEFKKVMLAIRDYAIGKDEWIPAANKLAFSNVLLGHFTESEASASVKAQLASARKKGWMSPTVPLATHFNCAANFGALPP